MRIGTDRCLSRAEQSSGQQGLHIPPAIKDEVDDDLLALDSVDYPVGLEDSLAVFLEPSAASSFG